LLVIRIACPANCEARHALDEFLTSSLEGDVGEGLRFSFTSIRLVDGEVVCADACREKREESGRKGVHNEERIQLKAMARMKMRPPE
jgi:hypothetical protein